VGCDPATPAAEAAGDPVAGAGQSLDSFEVIEKSAGHSLSSFEHVREVSSGLDDAVQKFVPQVSNKIEEVADASNKIAEVVEVSNKIAEVAEASNKIADVVEVSNKIAEDTAASLEFESDSSSLVADSIVAQASIL
jgi:methyl-accepting chemotaxis protein